MKVAMSRTMELMIGVPYGREFSVTPGTFALHSLTQGHILGSASVVLDCREDGVKRRLVFSGDIGRWGLPIIRDPVIPGGAEHGHHGIDIREPRATRRPKTLAARLATIIGETAARGGSVMIPAFAVGRTQELLYDFHGLYQRRPNPTNPDLH